MGVQQTPPFPPASTDAADPQPQLIRSAGLAHLDPSLHPGPTSLRHTRTFNVARRLVLGTPPSVPSTPHTTRALTGCPLIARKRPSVALRVKVPWRKKICRHGGGGERVGRQVASNVERPAPRARGSAVPFGRRAAPVRPPRCAAAPALLAPAAHQGCHWQLPAGCLRGVLQPRWCCRRCRRRLRSLAQALAAGGRAGQ